MCGILKTYIWFKCEFDTSYDIELLKKGVKDIFFIAEVVHDMFT